jgi:hypothetical protein
MKRHWSLTIWLNPRDWDFCFYNNNGFRDWQIGPFELTKSFANFPPMEVLWR